MRAARIAGMAGSIRVAALVLALCAASPATAQQAASPEVWKEHAAPDGDVGRGSRQLIPFTREQIEKLARLLEETRRATAKGTGREVRGRLRRVRLDADAIPEIRVRRGYTTVVGFTDLTGAPWPIEEVLVDRRFVPADGGEPAGHLLYLAPSEPFLAGNLAVKLDGLADPVVAVLAGGAEAADFRVDLRLGVAGPNVDPAALARPEAFRAGDEALAGILTGAVPPAAVRLEVRGGSPGDRAWRLGGDVLLVSRAHVLSPGPWAAERGAAGRWAYRLPATPFVLVSVDGREKRLALEEAATADRPRGRQALPASGPTSGAAR